MPSRTVRVFQVDAFTDHLFAGNPAGVVLGAEVLSEEEMQAIAHELNNSDSAFVLPAKSADHDVHLRFFTPQREAAFVGHASLAAHVARLAAGQCGPGRVRQLSRSGIYDVEIGGTADSPRVSVAFPAPAEPTPVSDEMRNKLLDILGLETAALDLRCPPAVIGRSSMRLLLGLRSAEQLALINPDFDALKRLTPHVGADGYFLFVRNAHGEGTTESRMFCPVIGIPEDPVSGNAHGMLGAYLVRHGLLPVSNGRAQFVGYQGRSLRRPGEVQVVVQAEGQHATRVQISGTARIVYSATVKLD